MIGDVQFIKGQGASGRQAAGEDYISGLLFYSATLPSGFSTTNRIKKLYSIVDAENSGILNDYSDASSASSSYTVPSVPAVGTSFNVAVLTPSGLLTLASYVTVTADTILTIAGNITQLINSQTYLTGYSATNIGSGGSSATFAVLAPLSLGLSANSLTLKVINSTVSGGAPLSSNFSGGAGSKLAVWHYHISEFFRANPSGNLFVGIFPVPTTYTFSEITTMQVFAVGKMRQIGIFKDAVYSNADLIDIDLIDIDLEIKTNDDAKHAPLSALYAGNLKGMSDITTLPNLNPLTANKVSSIVGQDGAGLGSQLFASYGKSITQLGFALGLLSLSAVSEDFGQTIDKFNLSNGTENDVPAFANGQLLSSMSSTAIDSIDSNRHIFGMNYIGTAGTYFNDNHTAIALSSDYAYINDNRVIDKACRLIYSALLPSLKSRLLKNADGTLASSTISFLQGKALTPLYQMNRDGDLSAVSKADVYIDPTQNVTMTSSLTVNVKLNEDGIARNILVPISFK